MTRFRGKIALVLGTATGLALFNGACGNNGSSSQALNTPNPGTSLPQISGPNVMALTVNGSLCSQGSYPDKPCVSVTVCAPGSSSCETINDVLLDSGSYGLRVFKSVLAANPAVAAAFAPASGANQLAECVSYGDGSSDWGPVVQASVVLGGEPSVTVPMQVIDAAYPSADVATQTCGVTDPSTGNRIAPDSDPSVAGFNGILGVGLFKQDCGTPCATSADNGVYFSCAGGACNPAVAALTDQVTDPVSALPQDSNGVILKLPNVPDAGAAFASGFLVLGIGTQSNNSPATGVTALTADPTSGQIQGTYAGSQYQSFLDSGSNGIFFPGDPTVFLDCGSTDPTLFGWFCPASTQSALATVTGTSGTPSTTVAFKIGNEIALSNSGNSTFADLGGNGSLGGSGTQVLDWGLPFFLGRSVYVGFENSTSDLGTGPYWAY